MSLAKAGTAKRVGGITNPATLEKLAAAGWEEPADDIAEKAAAEKAAADAAAAEKAAAEKAAADAAAAKKAAAEKAAK